MAILNPDEFDLSAFGPTYEIDLDPEFPADGVWRHSVHAFDREGHPIKDVPTRWGAPRYVLIRPRGADPWLGVFEHGGIGRMRGAWAMPDRSSLCVAVGGATYVVATHHPEAGATVASDSAQQVVVATDPALLIVVSFSDMIAFDAAGFAWQSPYLCRGRSERGRDRRRADSLLRVQRLA